MADAIGHSLAPDNNVDSAWWHWSDDAGSPGFRVLSGAATAMGPPGHQSVAGAALAMGPGGFAPRAAVAVPSCALWLEYFAMSRTFPCKRPGTQFRFSLAFID